MRTGPLGSPFRLSNLECLESIFVRGVRIILFDRFFLVGSNEVTHLVRTVHEDQDQSRKNYCAVCYLSLHG